MGTVVGGTNYFKIGDVVRYTGNYQMLSSYLLGEIGIVEHTYADKDEHGALQCSIVVWKDSYYNKGTCKFCHRRGRNTHCGHPSHGGSGVYSDNLELVIQTPTWEV